MAAYKPAKTLDEQIKYLKENKKVCFNIITEKQAKDILFYLTILMSLRRSNITLQNFQIKMRLSKKMEIMYMKMMLNLVNIMNCIKVKEKNIRLFQKISSRLKPYSNQFFPIGY